MPRGFRNWLCAALCAIGGPSWAQVVDLPPVDSPVLPSAAADAAGFVPPGWRLIATNEGDLDGDQRADLALILKMEEPANILTVAGADGPTPIDTNPYLLVIAFADPGAGYRLASRNLGLIRRRTQLYDGDDEIGPETVTIERGTMRVDFQHLRGATSFRFRWQGQAMRLIGYDQSGVAGGCIGATSINFLTRRARLEYSWQDEDEGLVRWLDVSAAPPVLEYLSFNDFTAGDLLVGERPYCRPRND
jgi:hypothetical protein